MAEDLIQPEETAFRLELTAAQLKIVHTALRTTRRPGFKIFEAIVSEWRLPMAQPPPDQQPLRMPLRAVSSSLEGRYKLRPGLYAAARFDHLGFSTITGTRETQAWDAPVTRVEVGGGYSIQRNLVLKISYQHNTRDGGPLLRTAKMTAVQLVFWF